MKKIVLRLLTVGVCLGVCARVEAQSESALAEKIRAMEKKLEDYDRLKARVAELEAKLGEGQAAAPESSASSEGAAEGPRRANVIAERIERLRIGGQVRMRSEWRGPAAYTPTSERPGDDWLILRTRLHLDADVSENVRIFVQLQDARVWGEDGNVADQDDDFGLHQGYVDLRNLFDHPFDLRLGRQELLFGKERLIGPLPWAVTGRAWDAIRATYRGENWQVDGFMSLVAEDGGMGGGLADEDQNFDGVYVSCKAVERHVFDLYALTRQYRNDPVTGEDGVPGNLVDYTLGVRAGGKTGGFDYDGEFAYRFGKYANDDIDAFGFIARAGYTFEHEWKPRIGLEFDYATGDDNPTDGDHGTFDPLFPFGHAYQGFADVLSWMNGYDVSATASFRPWEKWLFRMDYHNFWLEEEKDAWYNPYGVVIRRDATGNSGSHVGSDLDLTSTFFMNDSVTIEFGWAHFFAGSYVDRTGTDPDLDWVFIQLTADF